MAVMKSTATSRSSKVIPGYTPIKRPSQRNALTTTIRRPTIIKRSTPLQSTVATAVKPPSVTAEAKFASANTTFKDAIATFDSILSSISGSFPPEYQKSLQEAMNTIHAATSAITAMVEVAQLLPSQQLFSPPNGIISASVPSPAPENTPGTLNQDSTAATASIPENIVENQSESITTPQMMANSSDTDIGVDEITQPNEAPPAARPEEDTLTHDTITMKTEETNDKEQNIATTFTDESPKNAPLTSNLPPSYNYSNYLAFQELSLTEMTSDETKPPLNVIV